MKSNVAVRRSSLGRALATTTLLAAVSSSYYCRLLITSSSAVVVVSLQQSSSATTCASASRKRSIRHHICSPITITSSSTSLLHSNNDTCSSEEEGRRGRKKRLAKLQKQRRRNHWMKRYGTVEALQKTFGTGPPWGDLSPTQTRSLYHTLLPRSLLALNEMGFVTAEDLAPLAYEARIAAKEYARSRCVWTGRVGVFLFDQYRSLRDKGRLIQPGKSSSMSWEEVLYGGRGRKFFSRRANQQFMKLLKDTYQRHNDSQKQKIPNKRKIAHLAYLKWKTRNPPGRFLSVLEEDNFQEIDEVKILDRLCQSIRDLERAGKVGTESNSCMIASADNKQLSLESTRPEDVETACILANLGSSHHRNLVDL